MARSIRHGLYKWPGHRVVEQSDNPGFEAPGQTQDGRASESSHSRQPNSAVEHPKTGRGEALLSTGNINPDPGPQENHHKTGRGESLLSPGNVHPHPGPGPQAGPRRSRSHTPHPGVTGMGRRREASMENRPILTAAPVLSQTPPEYVQPRESYMGPRGLGPLVDWELPGLGSLLRQYIAQYGIFFEIIKQTFLKGIASVLSPTSFRGCTNERTLDTRVLRKFAVDMTAVWWTGSWAATGVHPWDHIDYAKEWYATLQWASSFCAQHSIREPAPMVHQVLRQEPSPIIAQQDIPCTNDAIAQVNNYS